MTTTTEILAERLRILAADLRLDSLPKKFRMTMNDAADAIERLTLTEAEREALDYASRMIDDINRGDPARAATLRSLLWRTDPERRLDG